MNTIEQDKGLKRNTIDKFYTKSNIAEKCMNNLQKHVDIDKERDLVIEPSAGSGSFIPYIKSISENYRFYDIEPENREIEKCDFLTLDYKNTIMNKSYRKVHVVGNPPFGRQSSLAIKFIKLCSQFSDTISFILPKSFKKDSLRKYFPLQFHLLHEEDIDKYSFSINGNSVDVPCIFQVWEKRDSNRIVKNKITPHGYVFVKKDENPHISFRRVGVNAGKIDKNIDKSESSHYFIKFTTQDKEDIDRKIIQLSDIEYDLDNTVGPRSISKYELMEKFNSVLN